MSSQTTDSFRLIFFILVTNGQHGLCQNSLNMSVYVCVCLCVSVNMSVNE